jgi:hypothetical protein
MKLHAEKLNDGTGWMVYKNGRFLAEFKGKEAGKLAKLLVAASDLLAACKQTRDWLASFSMPPTSTIQEKQDCLAILDSAIAKTQPE